VTHGHVWRSCWTGRGAGGGGAAPDGGCQADLNCCTDELTTWHDIMCVQLMILMCDGQFASSFNITGCGMLSHHNRHLS
jgi:hypothetical protein